MKLLVEESEFIYCDVHDILRYLRRRNPGAAVRFLEAFKSTVDLLSRMPHLGRLRPDLGVPQLRSWRVSVFRNYLVIVKVVDHHVAPDGTEEYSIEVFNALGDTIAVTAVPATALEPHSGVR